MARADATETLIAPVFAGNPVHEPVHESLRLPDSAGYGASSSATKALTSVRLASRRRKRVWQADFGLELWMAVYGHQIVSRAASAFDWCQDQGG